MGCITETIYLKLAKIGNSECSAMTNIRYWYEDLLALIGEKPVFGDNLEIEKVKLLRESKYNLYYFCVGADHPRLPD